MPLLFWLPYIIFSGLFATPQAESVAPVRHRDRPTD